MRNASIAVLSIFWSVTACTGAHCSRNGLYRLQRDLVRCAAVAVPCGGLEIAPSRLPSMTLACNMKLFSGMRCWQLSVYILHSAEARALGGSTAGIRNTGCRQDEKDRKAITLLCQLLVQPLQQACALLELQANGPQERWYRCRAECSLMRVYQDLLIRTPHTPAMRLHRPQTVIDHHDGSRKPVSSVEWDRASRHQM